MNDKTHALLSPSSAHRWLICPPIARLEQHEEVKEEQSIYADEGNLAHKYAELKLKMYTSQIYVKEYYEEFKKIKDQLNEELIDYIDNYTWEVFKLIKNLKDPKVFIEKKVYYSNWVPGGYGYADTVVHAEDKLYVIDLKYGRGIKVSATNNPQIMLYALGAYETLLKKTHQKKLKEIHLYVAQVRLNNYSHCVIPKGEMLYWAKNYLYPRAHQAYAGIGEWSIEDDAIRFSSVGARLTKRALKNFRVLAPNKLKDPVALTDNQLIKIFEASKEIKKWLTDIEKHLLALKKQKDIPGVKLVYSRPLRKITDEEEVIKILKDNGYEDIFELKSITKLEKIVGKEKLKELIGTYYGQSTPKVTIASASDKRVDITTLIEEFGDM